MRERLRAVHNPGTAAKRRLLPLPLFSSLRCWKKRCSRAAHSPARTPRRTCPVGHSQRVVTAPPSSAESQLLLPHNISFPYCTFSSLIAQPGCLDSECMHASPGRTCRSG